MPIRKVDGVDQVQNAYTLKFRMADDSFGPVPLEHAKRLVKETGVKKDYGTSKVPGSAKLPVLRAIAERDKQILAQITKVKKEMTKDEVVAILGEPNRREDDQWYYAISPLSQWIDNKTIKIKG